MLPARVLVADDDPSLLALVATALEGEGASVVRAESGAELVLRLVDHGPFDLVVTDISMPWMNGLEVAQFLRRSGQRMPVLFMTALKDSSLPERVRALGLDVDLLKKPFELAELEAAAQRLLAGRAAHASER